MRSLLFFLFIFNLQQLGAEPRYISNYECVDNTCEYQKILQNKRSPQQVELKGQILKQILEQVIKQVDIPDLLPEFSLPSLINVKKKIIGLLSKNDQIDDEKAIQDLLLTLKLHCKESSQSSSIICGKVTRLIPSGIWKNYKKLQAFSYLLSKTQKILSLLELIRDTNLGVGIGATALIPKDMSGFHLEALSFADRGEIAFYCAPATGMVTDIGINLVGSVIKTFGCYEPSDYKGDFLSFMGGVDPTYFVGLPLTTVSGKFSLGVDLARFESNFSSNDKLATDDTLALLKNGENFLDAEEFNVFQNIICLFSNEPESIRQCVKLTGKSNKVSMRSDIVNWLSNLKFSYRNVLQTLKTTLSATVPQKRILINLIDILLNRLGTCHAMSISAGFELSALPVSLGLEYSLYQKLTIFNKNEIEGLHRAFDLLKSAAAGDLKGILYTLNNEGSDILLESLEDAVYILSKQAQFFSNMIVTCPVRSYQMHDKYRNLFKSP